MNKKQKGFFEKEILLTEDFFNLVKEDINKAKKELKTFLKLIEKKEKIKLDINNIIENIETIKKIKLS